MGETIGVGEEKGHAVCGVPKIPVTGSKTIKAFLLAILSFAFPLRAVDTSPVSRAELLREIDEKTERVQRFLEAQELAGVLLTQIRNFSWITAGIADNHIVITSEVGPASLLIMRNGRRYLIANNSEVPRLISEDLKDLGYEAREFTWYEAKTLEIVREIAQGAPIGTDLPLGDLRLVDKPFAALRYQLTESEIKKYRWLGRNSTEAVIATLEELKPGLSEREIEALTSDKLMRRGIRPTVLLIGVDDRIYNFRHVTPSDTRLKKFAMVNITARRWGLVVAVTRLVHFGPVPEQLKVRMQAAAYVNAQVQAHTRPGVKAADLLAMVQKWYAEAGFEGQWKKHHQGGAIGYAERDWVAQPGSGEVVHARQAFAWNPTVEGAKVEDTIIVFEDHIENVTQTPGWPTISTQVESVTYGSPDILVREIP